MFVSYAQNFEDLMLWRALRDVPQGFYIDIGAADPDLDSVTRAFYERGWRGINVEPEPAYFAALVTARPRDINLQCLVGAAPGEAKMYGFPGTGLSTTDAETAARHAEAGFSMTTAVLTVRTLAEICRQHAVDNVHFLKIDVEGAEQDVLRGADFRAIRPWIMLIEATRPGSEQETWLAWEPLVTKADYRFAWFDGLNRFYIAAERWDALRHAFRTPPNVFDQWVHAGGRQQAYLVANQRAVKVAVDDAAAARAAAAKVQAELEAARMSLVAARAELNVDKVKLQRELIEANTIRANTELQLNAVLRSTSWRLTAPLRSAVVLLRRATRIGGRALSSDRMARLRRVAGSDRIGAKGAVRIGIYGFGRLVARLPAAAGIARTVRHILPGPYTWLHERYDAYRRSATDSERADAQPWDATPPGGDSGTFELAQEEHQMLVRLAARQQRTTRPPQ
jgi:FkbM family methyltransferase